MLLAIDIGNSNITIGLFKKSQLIKNWRLVTNSKKTADDYAVDIVELFLNDKIDCLQISGCMIVSVVPILTGKIIEAVKKFVSESIFERILVVGDGRNYFDIEIKVNKNEVGYDRVINAIAGYKKYGGNLIIVDFGTATTFDVVGNDGEYLGGVITAGVNISLKALHDMTAQLPKISLKPQTNVIGKNTFEAMNSGIYFGYNAMVMGIIDKIERELGRKTTRIVTGGLADIFKNQLNDFIDHYDYKLTLDGIRICYQKFFFDN